MPKLIMLSGPSGSGKSTIAKQIMEKDSNLVRLNRDLLRSMSILKWTPNRENWIIDAEEAMAKAAALTNRSVLIDDTNLRASDEERWRSVAKQMGYNFEKRVIEASIETCVARDALRSGSARLGRPAIERQFLRAKLWTVPEGMKTVIFDIDGTLADLGHRIPWITIGGDCPNCKVQEPESLKCKVCQGTGKVIKKQHDICYSLVEYDRPIEIVVKWIKALWGHYHIVIVSGRSPETAGDGTVRWLTANDIKYHHLLMRRPFHHGPDYEEKQLILDDILKIVPKEDILFVVDDRPEVIKMWKNNDLRVIPVRGREDSAFYEMGV